MEDQARSGYTGSKMSILLSRDKVRVLFTLLKKKIDRDQKQFHMIVTYFCSVIIFLSIQYQHTYPKIRNVTEKSLWNRKKTSRKKASQEISSLEHSYMYRNDTDSDEELPSWEFVQNVQDHCQKVSEQTFSEESVDSTTDSSSMTSTPALNAK